MFFRRYYYVISSSTVSRGKRASYNRSQYNGKRPAISSYKNRVIDEETLIFGEVGLSGEVRGVSQAQLRVKEAEKMGFTTCIMPKANLEGLKGKL